MEKDPTGRNQHEPGAKLDDGKLLADLVLGNFATALSLVCEIGTDGARKYTPCGWRSVPNGIDRYKNALLRHYLAVSKGEEIDKDSKSPHWAHIAWNALAIVELTYAKSNICEQKSENTSA